MTDPTVFKILLCPKLIETISYDSSLLSKLEDEIIQHIGITESLMKLDIPLGEKKKLLKETWLEYQDFLSVVKNKLATEFLE